MTGNKQTVERYMEGFRKGNRGVLHPQSAKRATEQIRKVSSAARFAGYGGPYR